MDASVLLARADPDDEHHAASLAMLSGTAPLATLDLAYYEVVNVALRAWGDPGLAGDLRQAVAAIERDGGLVRMDEALAAATAAQAARAGLSAYDAAYIVGAARCGARLVSCDLRDLVGPGFALTPAQALEQ